MENQTEKRLLLWTKEVQGGKVVEGNELEEKSPGAFCAFESLD